MLVRDQVKEGAARRKILIEARPRFREKEEGLYDSKGTSVVKKECRWGGGGATVTTWGPEAERGTSGEMVKSAAAHEKVEGEMGVP